MPVWHKATKAWREQGKLAVVGITQEQHAQRCRLFAQWQHIDWPILHDPINVTGPSVVPIVMAIDEHGIVRSVRPNVRTFERDFLDRTFEPPTGDSDAKPNPLVAPDLAHAKSAAEQSNTAAAWKQYGDELVLWGGDEQINSAIDAYRRALAIDPDDGDAHFRLGVCFRRRSETSLRDDGDFQRAVDAWGRGLDIDPNHYIRRRRIQQYGPRLAKPYPFYDWVPRAAEAIRARGDVPIELAVLPTGAEIAHPQRRFVEAEHKDASPDPEGRIHRDENELIQTEVVVVPARIKPGESARIHVTMRPDDGRQAHWNNENEPVMLWVDVPDGWQTDRRLLTAPLGDDPESTETRSIELELKAPDNAQDTVRVPAYLLYYVCEGVDGTCLYLRQDLPIDITLAP